MPIEGVHGRSARVDHGLQQVAALVQFLAHLERLEAEADLGGDLLERADDVRIEEVGLRRIDHQRAHHATPHPESHGGRTSHARAVGELMPRPRAGVFEEPVGKHRDAVTQRATGRPLSVRVVGPAADLEVLQVAAVLAERGFADDRAVGLRAGDPREQEMAVLDSHPRDRLVQGGAVQHARDRVVAAREHVVQIALSLDAASGGDQLALVAHDALHVRASLEFDAFRTHFDRKDAAVAGPVLRLEQQCTTCEHFTELPVGDGPGRHGPQLEHAHVHQFGAGVAVDDLGTLVAIDDLSVCVEQQDHVVGVAAHPGHALRRKTGAGFRVFEHDRVVALFGPPPDREQQRGQRDERKALEGADHQQQVRRLAEHPADDRVGGEDPRDAEHQVEERQPACPARRRLLGGHDVRL